jgi:hypothetical protein
MRQTLALSGGRAVAGAERDAQQTPVNIIMKPNVLVMHKGLGSNSSGGRFGEVNETMAASGPDR